MNTMPTKADSVTIKQLKADTIIGVYDWEQETRQTVLIDLELRYDMRPAAATDELEHAVDYAKISQRVLEHAEHAKLKLIETLATQIADLVLAEFAIDSCVVSVHKPTAVSEAQDTIVSIERCSKS